MVARALLHKDKLEALKTWLDSIGHEHRPGNGAWQELQIKWGPGWQVIYSRASMPEHLSVPEPLVPFIKKFIRETREPQPPAGHTAEELERDNPFNAWMRE